MKSIHLKTAIDYIKRSPFQASAAIFVLSLTFFVSTVLALVVFSSNNLIKYFESRPQVIAFLEDDIAAEAVADLQNKLTNDVRTKDVSYVSKEEALSIYKEATSDNPLLSELVSPAIFPASLEFSLVDLSEAKNVIDELKKEEIVEQVGFTASLGGESTLDAVVTRLRTITLYLRIGGGVFAGLLFTTSYLVLIIIISMRMTTRRKEIEILDLIGAPAKFIRSPILLEALIYTISGVLIGWLVVLVLTLYASPGIIRYFGEIPILPENTTSLFYLFGVILILEVTVGVFLALTGSLLAISRARRHQ